MASECTRASLTIDVGKLAITMKLVVLPLPLVHSTIIPHICACRADGEAVSRCEWVVGKETCEGSKRATSSPDVIGRHTESGNAMQRHSPRPDFFPCTHSPLYKLPSAAVTSYAAITGRDAGSAPYEVGLAGMAGPPLSSSFSCNTGCEVVGGMQQSKTGARQEASSGKRVRTAQQRSGLDSKFAGTCSRGRRGDVARR